MSNYYKVKTNKLNVSQYRSYVITKNNYWITKPVLIMDIYNCYPDTDKWEKANHPLVNKNIPIILLNGRITILRPYINIAAHLPSGSARTKGTYVLCMKPSRLSSSLSII